MFLHVDQLSKKFNDTHAVNNVSFGVGKGERVALLGPNGAGKSTTLLMTLGAITPTSGSVSIAGQPVATKRREALSHVGFAAAYLNIPRIMTVEETLKIAAGLAGHPLRSPLVNEIIERMEIGHLRKKMGAELSSGQRTLAGLARATLAKPELLILDEPTAYLDPHMSMQVRQKIDEICRDWGTALLITSHNMRDIDHLCDRVVFLHRGQVLYDMAPDELRSTVGVDDLDEAFIDIASTSIQELYEKNETESDDDYVET